MKLLLAALLLSFSTAAAADETEFHCRLAANDSSHNMRMELSAGMPALCAEEGIKFKSVAIDGRFDGKRYWLTFHCSPLIKGLGRYKMGLMRETAGGMRLVVSSALGRDGGDLVSYDYREDGMGEFELGCLPVPH